MGPVEVVGQQRVRRGHALDHQQSLAGPPPVDDGIRAPRAPRADGVARDLAVQRPAAHHGLAFHDEGPVVEHEVGLALKLRGHAARGRVAPAGDEHDAHARAASGGEGL